MSATDAHDDLRSDLESLYLRWFTEIGSNDPTYFREILAEDWRYIDVRGIVRGKEEYFDYIASIATDGPVNRLRELHIRAFGEIVLVHGTYDVDPKFAPIASTVTRFSAVWRHSSPSEWVALAHHATPVMDE